MKLKRIATSVLVALMLVSMFGVMLVFAPAPSPIPPSPVVSNVFVTNTSNDPVPVDITDNTLDVTLDEPVEVEGTVGIDDSTPIAVEVTNPIIVDGTSSQERVQKMYVTSLDDGDFFGGMYDLFEVPAGKMLVIEYVSAIASGIEPSDSLHIVVVTVLNGVEARYHLGVSEPQGRSSQVISEIVKICASSENKVQWYCERTSTTGDVVVWLTMSGYLVDIS